MPGSTAGRQACAPAALVLLVAAALSALLAGDRPAPFPGAVLRAAAGRLVPPPADAASGRPGRAEKTNPGVDIRRSGDPRQRITLVLLGDGYTADQMGLFRWESDRAWRSLMQVEPFRTYQHFFNIRRIEITSPVSGIRETPSLRRAPATPLGMHFWCDGTARLLCVDEHAAERYADGLPGPHFLIAVANSGRYGGAGGSGVTTLAGGSPDAGRIIQHEMGHTIGDLGDEYDSAPRDAGYPNLSTEDAGEMLRTHTKWWRWLGVRTPDGEVVGAYRGANGLYRPTADSVMRTLGHDYNPPSREAVVMALYRRIGPLDGAWPAAGGVTGRPRLRVRPVRLSGPRQLQVTWALDGHPLRPQGTAGTSYDTSRLALAPGRSATITATVQDTTDWVRDETFRLRHMTRMVSWTLHS